MELEIKIRHIATIVLGAIIILLDYILLYGAASRWFKPLIAVGILIAISQFWLDFMNENRRQKEIEVKFLEFVRGLVETVKSGIPIPKAIIHVSSSDFGALNPYVKKLSNQIEWGMPLREALTNFARDTNNRVIVRSVSIVIEAERSGGNIDEVLNAVAKSIVQIKKIRDERRSNTYSQMVQGYFVFFIFIAIMLVLKIFLLPQLGDVAGAVKMGFGGGFEAYMEEAPGVTAGTLDFDNIFIWLVLIQGFFMGVMIGKFAEGDLKSGLKHSGLLMVIGYLLITTIRGF